MQIWSKTIALLFLITVTFSALQKHGVYDQTTNVITYDVYGYYLYLPAIFIYNQTDSYEFVNEHFANYKLATKPYQITQLDNGKTAPIYSGGMAMLYSPFFFAADIFVKTGSRYARDGLSFPYQLSMVLATLFYVFLGIFFLRKILVELYSDKVAAATILFLGFGTNFFHYSAFESGMAHTFVLGLYAPWLWLTIRWHRAPEFKTSAFIGLLSGLICLARPSEAVLVLLFFFYAVGTRFSLAEKFNFFIKNLSSVAVIISAGLLTLLPQILFWKINLGMWIFNGYGEEHFFEFSNPHIYEALFSYRKGWLLYNPIMLFALLGIFYLKKQKSDWFWSVLTFTVLSIYVIFSWHMWWYSSSFGNRGIVQIYPILAIGMGAFLTAFAEKPFWAKALFGIIATALLGLNQFQDLQYRTRVLPHDKTTEFYYWKVFLKTQNQLPTDVRKFLFLDEELPEGNYQSVPFASFSKGENLIDNSKNLILPGKEFYFSTGRHLDEKTAAQFSEKWIRVSTKIKQYSDKYHKWEDTKLVLVVERKSEQIVWEGLPVQQFLKTGEFTDFHFEKKLPTLQSNDLLKAYFWNKSPDTLEVESLIIEGLSAN